MKNIGIAKITATNPLVSDDTDQVRMEHVPAEVTYTNSRGELKVAFFKNADGKKLSEREQFLIVNQKSFDLDNPIDKHNWDVLKGILGLPEMASLKESITLIEPAADAKRKLERERREQELIRMLFDKEKDTDFLARLYRHVVGMSDGITSGVMLSTLIDLAKTDLSKFMLKGKWVYETDDWEMRGLIDLCIERRILQRDGEFIKNADGTIIADSYEKAIYKIKVDDKLRSNISSRLNDKPSGPATDFAVENSEFLDALDGLSESVDQTPVNPDGTLDEAALKDREKKEIDDLIDLMLNSPDIIRQEGDEWELSMEGHKVTGRAGLFDFLKSNEELVKNYKELLA